MSRYLTATAAAAMLMVAASHLEAQTTCTGNPCTVQVTASATVNDVLRLTLSSNTANLGTPTDVDYDAGYKDAAGPTATIKSNRPWHVDVVGNTASFSYSGSLTDPNKPASDLQWGLVSGTYSNNMGSSAVLASGANGTGNASQAIFFRTLWSWTSGVPGSYGLVINFTLAAP